MVRLQDPTQFHALYQALSQVDQGFHRFFKANHQRLQGLLHEDAQILVQGAYQGQELISLSALNAKWRLVGLEPEPRFLRTAQSRVEALDLDDRMRLLNHNLHEYDETGFHAALCSLKLNFHKEEGNELQYLTQLFGKLEAGGWLLLSIVKPTQVNIDELSEQLGADRHLLEGIFRLVHAYSDDEMQHLFNQAGFREIHPCNQTPLMQSYLLRKE